MQILTLHIFSGAFSGLLAFAISKMDGIGGLDGWRWIFILEGIMTVLVAVISFFVIYDNPGTAAFLTPTERVFIIHKLRYQGSVSSQPGAAPPEELRWQYIKAAFQDWQVYVAAVMNIGIGVPLFGISLFLPTIVNELGYTATTAQLLTVPIYSAAAVCSVTTAYFSDRAQSRFPFVFGSLFTAFVGLIITITASSHGGVPGVVYAGILVTVCGLYPAFPANVTWLANNLAGSSKRGVGMAIHIAFGNMGGGEFAYLFFLAISPFTCVFHFHLRRHAFHCLQF
jgi:sugar phosphate permease